MRPLNRVSIAATVCFATLVPASRAIAEDTKGKWQFGFGLSYYSTVDYIRSNADLAIASVERQPDGSLANVGSTDDRPDINLVNQASVRDDFKVDFNASYGLTRWLALEAAGSYMKAPVGNIEFYVKDRRQEITAQTDSKVPSCGPDLTSDCWEWQPTQAFDLISNTFVPVGTVTEIPIHLSTLIRFRPESPFDPYIGIGGGYILTKLETGEEFNQVKEFFGDPNFRVTIGDEGEFNVNTRCRRESGQGCTDFHPGPLEANLKNAWEWHAIGGVDYYMSDRFSVYVDARYTWTSGAIDIRTDDAHQVRFAVIDPGRLLLTTRLYRDMDPNDRLSPGIPSSGPFLWEDIGVEANRHFHEDICPECQDDGYLETEDKNMSGALDDQCVGGVGFCEDEGWLYKLPPGSRDIDESLKMPCPDLNGDGEPDCAHNHVLDTEDANGNGFLDRFLVYGLDICTTDRAAGNPRCTGPVPANNNNITYIWPEGCPQTPEQLSPFSQLTENGCPPFAPANPATGSRPSLHSTSADNAADTFILQGGRIRLGGFALGVGFKFTF